jgi:hypothetical protein
LKTLLKTPIFAAKVSRRQESIPAKFIFSACVCRVDFKSTFSQGKKCPTTTPAERDLQFAQKKIFRSNGNGKTKPKFFVQQSCTKYVRVLWAQAAAATAPA